AEPRHVHGDESDPREGSDGHDRHDRAGVPAAHVPDVGGQPAAAQGHPRSAAAPQALTPHAVTDVVVAGAAGPMGSRLVAGLREHGDLRLVGALEAAGHPALLKDAGELAGVPRVDVPITADAEAVLAEDRVLIEFSVPEATLTHLRLVAATGARAVIGTTGFSAAQRHEIESLARRAAILISPNMSVAVNVAFRVLAD